jgi:hypothetical protein
MSEPLKQDDCEAPIDTPGRRLGEAPRPRSIRLRWRGLKVYLFWKVGIKVTRPKKVVAASRPQAVPRLESKP